MRIFGEWGHGRGASHPSIMERYTEPARRAVSFARHEAMRRGASVITVGDLLAGLSVEDDTRAERVGSLKLNASYLRWLVGLPALPALEFGEISREETALEENRAYLDSEARQAMAYAVLEADRDRDYWIDTDHLLRGLMRFPNKADFALLKTEISLDSMRHGSRVDREEFLPKENPNMKVVKYLAIKWTALLVPPALSLACYLYILFEGIGLTTSLAR